MSSRFVTASQSSLVNDTFTDAIVGTLRLNNVHFAGIFNVQAPETMSFVA